MLLIIALAGTILLAGLLLGLYATQVEPYRPRLRRIAVTVPPNWPPLTILHLSDLHVRTGNDRLYRAQERLLRSIPGSPDLVCVTGDLCEQLVDAPRAAALIGLVRPRLETLVVLGNHEHHAPLRAGPRRATATGWGLLARLAWRLLETDRHSTGTEEAHAIGRVLAAAGLRVMLNEGQRFPVNGGAIWVAGSDSIWSGCGRPGPSKATGRVSRVSGSSTSPTARLT